ncbi:MAG: exopolyphosphatase [Fibromonadaceae bacterium]|jgi:nanoRNase/pAp phosphatase (c-di-AMP/oligoRNAs hydrolase)|nr:exopolyphosphatase [Fibromonadaceae bacterium]
MNANLARLKADGKKYRLVTRSDFDGLVCGMLLTELDLVDDIKFVHPKDMQDGLVELTERDISTNLPYQPSCAFVFDPHESEMQRNADVLDKDTYIVDGNAPSASRVVYDWLGGKDTFPRIDVGMMSAVDKADSAQFTREDILEPKDWELLSFLMDSRTGLGRFREFRISNYQLMMELISYCKSHTIDEILKHPDVDERIQIYRAHEKQFREQVLRCTKVHKNLGILDLREEETIWAGNRFMIYALFPEINISIHVLWGLRMQNTVFATGKSIFDRSSKTDIGVLMLKYGGGGHVAAGTCQVPNDQAAKVLSELIEIINSDG